MKIRKLNEASEGFQKEFYNGYVILKNRAGDGWDIYSYEGTPEKVTRAVKEEEGLATLKDAKATIDSWAHKESLDEGGYKITIEQDGKTFADYCYDYKEESAIAQMKAKYGDNIEIKNIKAHNKVNESKSIDEGWSGDTYKGYSILLNDDSINWDAEQVRLVWRILDKDGNKVGSVAGQANARKFVDEYINNSIIKKYIGAKVEFNPFGNAHNQVAIDWGEDEEDMRKLNGECGEITAIEAYAPIEEYPEEDQLDACYCDVTLDNGFVLNEISGSCLDIIKLKNESINESKATHCVYFTQDGVEQIEFEGSEDECNRYISDIQAEQDDEFGDEAPERFIKKLHEQMFTLNEALFTEDYSDEVITLSRYLDVEVPDICNGVLDLIEHLPSHKIVYITKICRDFYAKMESIIKNYTMTGDNFDESLQEDVTDVVTDTLSGPTEGPESGLSALLNEAVQDEFKTIQMYNDIAVSARAEGFEDIATVVDEINTEENKHVGQLQELLKTVSPNAKAIDTGEIEGQQQIGEVTDIVEEDLNNSNSSPNNNTEEDDKDMKESWEEVYQSFKTIEKELNGDGEAITATIDQLYRDNKGNPDYEKAYKKWAAGE